MNSYPRKRIMKYGKDKEIIRRNPQLRVGLSKYYLQRQARVGKILNGRPIGVFKGKRDSQEVKCTDTLYTGAIQTISLTGGIFA